MLENNRVLIAGAGGLLGARLVKSALDNNAEVLAVDIDMGVMVEKLEEVAVDIKLDNLQLAQLDVTDEAAVISLFDQQEWLTGAVNCTYPRNESYGADFFDVSLESFNENVSLHLGSAFLFAQQCAAYFKRKGMPFSLVNISSIYGVVAPDFTLYENTDMTMPVEYAAIKSAIVHLNKYVSAYVKDSQFRVNSISPGGILNAQPASFLNAYAECTHGKGMLDVDDVTGSVLFLLSSYSRYITGQNIIVDDGFSL